MSPDFDRLYSEQAEPLLRFLVYRTGERALAEDILADTFERVLRSRRGPEPGQERAWLYTIALNRLRDLSRRRGAEERALAHVEPNGNGHANGLALEDRDSLARALASLPDAEREVIALRYGADLSLREVSEVLGESQTTVHGRIYRGLRHLRRRLAEDVAPTR